MTAKIITIGDIAKQMKLKPREARQRLRRAAADKVKFPAPVSETRWVWPQSKATQVKKVLSR